MPSDDGKAALLQNAAPPSMTGVTEPARQTCPACLAWPPVPLRRGTHADCLLSPGHVAEKQI